MGDTVLIIMLQIEVKFEFSVLLCVNPVAIEYDAVWDKKCICLIVSDSGRVPSSRNKHAYYLEHARMCF